MKTLQSAYRRPDRHVIRRRNHQGFNLIEITLTILIMGILFAVAAPVYSKSLFRFRAESAAQRIVQDIEHTKQLARQTNTTRMIVFSKDDSSYTVDGAISLDNSLQPYLVSLNQYPYRTSIHTLTTTADPSRPLSAITLAFDRFGMPDQGVSITVQSGDIQKQVVVTAILGRVTVL
jgi:prepilin-type N-terminal cleavage/methylation domain-containing protein